MLTQSALKIIAMLTMFVDHCGMLLFPEVAILRIIGRLSFPIFAYLIAEGLTYTKNKVKYLQRILLCALAFQAVSLLVLQTFVPSVLFGYVAAVGFAILRDKKWPAPLLLVCGFVASLLLMALKVDYYCFSFLLILAFCYIKKPALKWAAAAAALLGISLFYRWQLWSLLALPLLMLYKGKRGNLRIGKFMYWFYPLHFLALGLVKLLIH